MALSKALRDRIEKAKQNVDIKDVIESTGAQPVRSNAAKGEYIYNAPYREDTTPSLVLNVFEQRFYDHGQPDAKGDVIQLARLLHGRGDASSFQFMDALKWLERFSSTSVAPQAFKPAPRPRKPPVEASPSSERLVFVKAQPVTSKTHPNNRDYITETRKIPLSIAVRHLHVITYRDTHAPIDDPLRQYRYGLGMQNDVGGWEVRSTGGNFKTSLGAKGVKSYLGKPNAPHGHVFNGQFDFLTQLAIEGEDQPSHPTIITNSDTLMGEAGRTIRNHPDLQHVKTWLVFQDNDNSGDIATQAFIEELKRENDDYQVYTVNSTYEGYKDLNKFWTDAPADRVTKVMTAVRGNTPKVQKTYDTSASAEARRTHDERIKNSIPKLF